MSLNRKVAVKLLSNSLISDKLQREQFENESKIIAMLHHPNIVKVLSAKCTSECCYYAMEFIDGKGLNHYKISDIKNIARIGLQVSKALAYAHSCKIMHRDIKPANLLLDESGQVHVSDFGLAFIVKSKNSKTGQPDAKSGTLRYMAPEIPDDVRECLIDLQLDRLGLIARTRSREAAYDLSVKIKNELNLYNGRRKQEFINRYNNLTFKKIK